MQRYNLCDCSNDRRSNDQSQSGYWLGYFDCLNEQLSRPVKSSLNWWMFSLFMFFLGLAVGLFFHGG